MSPPDHSHSHSQGNHMDHNYDHLQHHHDGDHYSSHDLESTSASSSSSSSSSSLSLSNQNRNHARTRHDKHQHSVMNKNDKDKKEKKTVLQRLYTATILCATFFTIELIGGLWSHSLAILSDAAHLSTDLASFGVAIVAAHLAAMPSSKFHTYGLKRIESLAALLSMISLALVSIGLAYEAMRRLILYDASKQAVDGRIMSSVAAIGVVVNIVLALVLGEHHTHHMPGASDHHHHGHAHNHHHHGHNHSYSHEHTHSHHDDCSALEHDSSDECTPLTSSINNDKNAKKQNNNRNINLHAAYIHVMGDLAQSAAVLFAGLVIYWQPTWHLVDPICTLLFCAMVFSSTIPVILSSLGVLMEQVPRHIDWAHVHDAIQKVDNVTGVHDLHIWSISHGIPGLSVHCFVLPPPPCPKIPSLSSSSSLAATTTTDDDTDHHHHATMHHEQALRDIHQVCATFGISHVTIQTQLITDSSSTAMCLQQQQQQQQEHDSGVALETWCITCRAAAKNDNSRATSSCAKI